MLYIFVGVKSLYMYTTLQTRWNTSIDNFTQNISNGGFHLFSNSHWNISIWVRHFNWAEFITVAIASLRSSKASQTRMSFAAYVKVIINTNDVLSAVVLWSMESTANSVITVNCACGFRSCIEVMATISDSVRYGGQRKYRNYGIFNGDLMAWKGLVGWDAQSWIATEIVIASIAVTINS